MAVVPPTPPTPPTPPSVTLQEGGSVTQSTAPQDVQGQSEDAHNEALARQAVAQGDGALTKATRSQPQTDAKVQQTPPGGQQSQEQTPTQGGAQLDPQTAALLQDGQQGQQNAQANGAQNGQQTSMVAQAAQALTPGTHLGGQGAMFWIGVILLCTVVGGFFLRRFMQRKQGGLSFHDFAPEEPVDPQQYTGMHPDEVLAQLEAEPTGRQTVATAPGVRRQLAPAYAAEPEADVSQAQRARQQLQAAARRQGGTAPATPPVRPVPATQVNSYVPPTAPPDEAVVVQRPVPERTDGHFEVRV